MKIKNLGVFKVSKFFFFFPPYDEPIKLANYFKKKKRKKLGTWKVPRLINKINKKI
jgi:hypothetical protein